MAERGAKKPARKPARRSAGAGSPRRGAAAPPASRRSAADPATRIAELESERDRLAFELDTARERIRVLEERQSAVVKRIDGVIDSLHKLLDE